jgi:hypothetical protein
MVVFAHRWAEHGAAESSSPWSPAHWALMDRTERTRDERAVAARPPQQGPATVTRPPGRRRLPSP